MYAVMIDVIPELDPGTGSRMRISAPDHVPTGSVGAPEGTGGTLPLVRRMTSEDELFADHMIVIVNAGDITVGVASSADLAGVITVGVTSSADLAGDVTVGVASSAALAGDVTVGVASLAALAGDVTVSVASSADLDAGVADGVTFLADLAGVVTAGVMSAAASDDVVLSDPCVDQCNDGACVDQCNDGAGDCELPGGMCGS